jgi:hypothetical protein
LGEDGARSGVLETSLGGEFDIIRWDISQGKAQVPEEESKPLKYTKYVFKERQEVSFYNKIIKGLQ